MQQNILNLVTARLRGRVVRFIVDKIQNNAYRAEYPPGYNRGQYHCGQQTAQYHHRNGAHQIQLFHLIHVYGHQQHIAHRLYARRAHIRIILLIFKRIQKSAAARFGYFAIQHHLFGAYAAKPVFASKQAPVFIVQHHYEPVCRGITRRNQRAQVFQIDVYDYKTVFIYAAKIRHDHFIA